MRYFFLIFSLLGLLMILILPNRFGKFSQTEWRLFPDMDEQDVATPQDASDFFADGRVARTPDKNTIPMGFAPLTEETRDLLPEFGFTNGSGYVFTGKNGDAHGNGIPKEFKLESIENRRQFLAHGRERYQINCSPCHGLSSDGKGAVSAVPSPFIIPALNAGNVTLLPDGNIFEIITDGRGQMGSFKHNTSIKDRWAIVAYLRSVQDAKKAADEAAK